LVYSGPSLAYYSFVASVRQFDSISSDRVSYLHHHRWFLLRQHGCHLLSIGRDYRLHEPSHRVTHLCSGLANWFYHRVICFTNRLGSLIIQLDSPLIGGTFSNPANAFPNLFSHDLFRTYPYFLPGCIAAVISVTGAIFGYVFLEEVRSLPNLPFSSRSRNIVDFA